jgi:hypothetical protein
MRRALVRRASYPSCRRADVRVSRVEYDGDGSYGACVLAGDVTILLFLFITLANNVHTLIEHTLIEHKDYIQGPLRQVPPSSPPAHND